MGNSNEFKDIPGFPGYSINREGKVIGRRGSISWMIQNGRPFFLPRIARGCGHTKLFIGAAVLSTFIRPRDNKEELRYLDGNPMNNSVDNLAWEMQTKKPRLPKPRDPIPEGYLPIPGFPGFHINNTGDVIGRLGRVMRPMRDPQGYSYIIPVRGKKLRIHRAVLMTFVGSPGQGRECRHLDGDPGNNCLSNLAWGTRLENSDDKKIHGTLPFGEKSGSSKLTEKQVLEIRDRVTDGEPICGLAKEFKVSHTCIRKAALKMSWSYLK